MEERLRSLRTEPFAAEREWMVEGVPVLSAAVEVPAPEAQDRISRRVRRFYQLQCRAFLRYCERALLPQAAAEYWTALSASRPLPAFRAELRYRVTYNEGGLWSLYTQSRESTGAGPALLTRRGDTWDLATGYPVPLKDFFPSGTAWKKRLLARAEEEFRRRERAGAGRWREDWRRELRRRFNPQNFYLTEEGLACFWPMYAIAPAPEGVPVFLLPYASMEGLCGGANLPAVQSPARRDQS
ncbi:RsiV family protein [Oscillospiraceae bacterium 38-13]